MFRATLIVFLFTACAYAFDDIDFDRPTLGGTFVGMDTARTSVNEFPTKEGMVLLYSPKSSPLARVGLNGLDVVTHINKRKIKTDDDYDKAMGTIKVGSPVEVVGYSPIDGGDRLTWRKGTLKVTPVSLRQFIKDSVRIEHDKFKDITYYFHREYPEHVKDDLSVYLFQSGSLPIGMFARMNYNADDWLFVQSFSFVGDDIRFDIKPHLLTEVHRDNARGRVWEWYDAKADAAMIENIRKLAESGKCSMRYEAKSKTFDRTISFAEKERIRLMLMALKMYSNH